MIRSSIRTTYQALLLLHRLIFGTESVSNLRQKLNQADQIPQSPFNGVVHMFVVTFGRLSYADGLQWVDLQVREELEQMASAFYSLRLIKHMLKCLRIN
jgi:hypothetical protein